MQSWDYRLGINGVKRTQAAYNSALVAQGAFSAYWTDDIRAVGGWPDAIGEDIVLTWSLMASRGPRPVRALALASRPCPSGSRHFMRQRSRWARGMFEGIRINPPHRQPRVLAKFVAGIDYLVPLLDIGYVFFWVPGRDPVLLRLPAAVLVVVDARAPDHAGHLRAAAPLAGTPRVPPPRCSAPSSDTPVSTATVRLPVLASSAALRGYRTPYSEPPAGSSRARSLRGVAGDLESGYTSRRPWQRHGYPQSPWLISTSSRCTACRAGRPSTSGTSGRCTDEPWRLRVAMPLPRSPAGCSHSPDRRRHPEGFEPGYFQRRAVR